MRALASLILLLAVATSQGAWGELRLPGEPAPGGWEAATLRIPGTGSLLMASALDVSAAEAPADGFEGLGVSTTRAMPAQGAHATTSPTGFGESGVRSPLWTPSCLLGFRGHPSTAPPRRA